MAEYKGSNSNSTMGANLKEVYPKNNKFAKLKKMLGHGQKK